MTFKRAQETSVAQATEENECISNVCKCHNEPLKKKLNSQKIEGERSVKSDYIKVGWFEEAMQIYDGMYIYPSRKGLEKKFREMLPAWC